MIQKLYNSDIRSMINFLQLNQNINEWETNIIKDVIWENIHNLLINKEISENNIFDYINNISIQYNTDKKSIIKNYFNFIIRNKKELVCNEFLSIIEGSIHVTDSNIQHILLYFIHHLQEFYKTKN
jgi:DNA polymerase III delta prime subunit